MIIIKKPNQEPEILEQQPDLEILQAAVGGLIESVHVRELQEAIIDCYANEEGLLLGLEPNITTPFHPMIVGPVVFCSFNEEGESVGLNDYQIEIVQKFLEKHTL